MSEIYHILNGDALGDRFPSTIDGQTIILRECLVDGPVTSSSLEELFHIRSKFLSDQDGMKYYSEVVPELRKLLRIEEDATINFWFEDDLFCQVNFWFATNILGSLEANFYYVRPNTRLEFGFGGLDEPGLLKAFENAKPITSSNLQTFSRLWHLYQADRDQEMLQTAKTLSSEFDFVLNAVKAQIDRKPDDSGNGRPERSLLQIRDELKTDEFAPIFREFVRRDSIYGFGDLQVRRMLSQLLNEN